MRVSSVPWSPEWSPSSWAPEPPIDLQWARWGSGEPGQGVHLFVDDWRLESLARGTHGRLGQGRTWATEPDFSVLAGMPEEVQRWQVYRARYCGDRLRALGLQVLPVITWTGADPFGWTFWGVRPGSAIAVRAPGRDGAERDRWAWGYQVAARYFQPSSVLVFGLANRVQGCLDAAGIPWRQVPLRRTRLRLVQSGERTF